MSNTYKKTEVVGISEKSFADAVNQAVKRTSKAVRNLSWFEVTEMRGQIKDGKVNEFQVTVKIGFRLED